MRVRVRVEARGFAATWETASKTIVVALDRLIDEALEQYGGQEDRIIMIEVHKIG